MANKKGNSYCPCQEKTEKFVSEGDYHFIRETGQSEKLETKKPFPTKKVIGFSLAAIIIGVLIWYAPTIISYFSEASYTKLIITKSPLGDINCTSLTFGDLDYDFAYSWNDLLLVSNSLLETKTYQPVKGAVYVDIGVEIKVSEIYSDNIVILVKPNPQDYLAKSSFKKLTIANGQYQSVNFSGNEYVIAYSHNPPYEYRTLMVATPLLQTRQYHVSSSQIITCDLGLEIRVYKATDSHITIYVKPSY